MSPVIFFFAYHCCSQMYTCASRDGVIQTTGLTGKVHQSAALRGFLLDAVIL